MIYRTLKQDFVDHSSVSVDYRVTHYPEARASYLYLPNHPGMHGCVKRTDDLGHGVHVDRDENGAVIGVEWLWGA